MGAGSHTPPVAGWHLLCLHFVSQRKSKRLGEKEKKCGLIHLSLYDDHIGLPIALLLHVPHTASTGDC